MKKIIIHAKKIINNKNGVAMTEVLVAFLVLMMCLAMLYTCMRLASNFIHKTADADRSRTVYQKNLEETVKNSSYPETGSGSITYTFQNGYSLKLDTGTITATDGDGNTRDVPVFVVEDN